MNDAQFQTPTQPYIKRNRSSSLISNGCTTNLKNIDHNTINDCTYNGDDLNGALSTFTHLDRNTEEVYIFIFINFVFHYFQFLLSLIYMYDSAFLFFFFSLSPSSSFFLLLS